MVSKDKIFDCYVTHVPMYVDICMHMCMYKQIKSEVKEGRPISGNYIKLMDLHGNLPQRNRIKPLVLLVCVTAVSVSQSVYTCCIYVFCVRV